MDKFSVKDKVEVTGPCVFGPDPPIGSVGEVMNVASNSSSVEVRFGFKLSDGTDWAWFQKGNLRNLEDRERVGNILKVRNMTREELAKFLARPCPYDSDKCIELGHETCEACFLDWLSK